MTTYTIEIANDLIVIEIKDNELISAISCDHGDIFPLFIKQNEYTDQEVLDQIHSD